MSPTRSHKPKSSSTTYGKSPNPTRTRVFKSPPTNISVEFDWETDVEKGIRDVRPNQLLSNFKTLQKVDRVCLVPTASSTGDDDPVVVTPGQIFYVHPLESPPSDVPEDSRDLERHLVRQIRWLHGDQFHVLTYKLLTRKEVVRIIRFKMRKMHNIQSQDHYDFRITPTVDYGSDNEEDDDVGDDIYTDEEDEKVPVDLQDDDFTIAGLVNCMGEFEVSLTRESKIISIYQISCPDDVCRIFNDTDPFQRHIRWSGSFYRASFQLHNWDTQDVFQADSLWKMNKTQVMAKHCICRTFYNPQRQRQRYCEVCCRWFCCRCLVGAETVHLGERLVDRLCQLPIERGWKWSEKRTAFDNFSIVGTGLLVQQFRRKMESLSPVTFSSVALDGCEALWDSDRDNEGSPEVILGRKKKAVRKWAEDNKRLDPVEFQLTLLLGSRFCRGILSMTEGHHFLKRYFCPGGCSKKI